MRQKINIENYMQKLEIYSDWYCKNYKSRSDKIKKRAKLAVSVCQKAIIASAFVAVMCFVEVFVH